jgi:hypothetical protein
MDPNVPPTGSDVNEGDVLNYAALIGNLSSYFGAKVTSNWIVGSKGPLLAPSDYYTTAYRIGVRITVNVTQSGASSLLTRYQWSPAFQITTTNTAAVNTPTTPSVGALVNIPFDLNFSSISPAQRANISSIVVAAIANGTAGYSLRARFAVLLGVNPGAIGLLAIFNAITGDSYTFAWDSPVNQLSGSLRLAFSVSSCGAADISGTSLSSNGNTDMVQMNLGLFVPATDCSGGNAAASNVASAVQNAVYALQTALSGAPSNSTFAAVLSAISSSSGVDLSAVATGVHTDGITVNSAQPVTKAPPAASSVTVPIIAWVIPLVVVLLGILGFAVYCACCRHSNKSKAKAMTGWIENPTAAAVAG